MVEPFREKRILDDIFAKFIHTLKCNGTVIVIILLVDYSHQHLDSPRNVSTLGGEMEMIM